MQTEFGSAGSLIPWHHLTPLVTEHLLDFGFSILVFIFWGLFRAHSWLIAQGSLLASQLREPYEVLGNRTWVCHMQGKCLVCLVYSSVKWSISPIALWSVSCRKAGWVRHSSRDVTVPPALPSQVLFPCWCHSLPGVLRLGQRGSLSALVYVQGFAYPTMVLCCLGMNS